MPIPEATGAAALTALDAHARLTRGELRALEYAQACLARTAAVDPDIRAWRCLDRNLVLENAERLDAHRKTGKPTGPLHGLPVGIKDIIDTADMPTENGTCLDEGRRPREDAVIVSRLRAAGAIVFGKTATTELAFQAATDTRNPHDTERTPGGSSSGSAAAVAANMVPLAIGTQTGGSVIRPASYCGVVGFKPSHGLVPRSGVLAPCRPLDTVGVFARTIEDAALLVDVIAGHHAADADCLLEAPPQLLSLAQSRAPLAPALAFVRQPVWDQAETSTHEAFLELKSMLGDQCDEVELPAAFEEAIAAHKALQIAGFARHLGRYYESGGDKLSQVMRTAIEQGRGVLATEYLAALDLRERLRADMERLFERYDAIVTPATTGEAPPGLASTGSAVFNSLWSYIGVPAVTLPLMEGPNGLPLGVQVVGRRGHDGRLLRTARWLTERVAAKAETAS